MTFEAWLLFCATETVLCLSPGPSVLLVVTLGLTRGLRPAWRASFGVIAANGVYFGIAATGVAGLASASSTLFGVVRWAGAAYLIALGVRMLLSARRGAGDRANASLSERALRRPFAHGFVAHGANPNLLVYFTAILPQFVSTDAPLAPQVAIIALSSFAIELAVLAGYAVLAARGARLVRDRGLDVRLRQAGGVLLVGAGARLAVTRDA